MINYKKDKLISKLIKINGVLAICIAGSKIYESTSNHSDIDLGIYYKDSFDVQKLKNIFYKESEITQPIVTKITKKDNNPYTGYAWAVINGVIFDIPYIDLTITNLVIKELINGEFNSFYYQTFPYGYHSYMILGSLSNLNIIYDPQEKIKQIKKKINYYPIKLKESIIKFFLNDCQNIFNHINKYQKRQHVHLLIGSITRVVDNVIQVLYALNEQFFYNYKMISIDYSNFRIKPRIDILEYEKKIIFELNNNDQTQKRIIYQLKQIYSEMLSLCYKHYQPKTHLYKQYGWF